MVFIRPCFVERAVWFRRCLMGLRVGRLRSWAGRGAPHPSYDQRKVAFLGRPWRAAPIHDPCWKMVFLGGPWRTAPIHDPPSKPCWRQASKTVTATALDRFRLRWPARIGKRRRCWGGNIA